MILTVVVLEALEQIKDAKWGDICLSIQNSNNILSQSDLYEILPFGKTKVQQLIKSGELPLLKVGKDYITTFNILEEWIRNHVGEEIYY